MAETASVQEVNASQAMFVLVVFIIFLATSALCFCCSVLRWRRNRRSRQQNRLAAQISHYNRRVAAASLASMEQMSQEDKVDAAIRLKVLTVMFPEPKIDCTHLVYDCESKRYTYQNETEAAAVDEDTSCSICLEMCEPEDTIVTGICNHSYHRDCIVGWLQIKNECPYCRKGLWEDEVFDEIKMEIKSDEASGGKDLTPIEEEETMTTVETAVPTGSTTDIPESTTTTTTTEMEPPDIEAPGSVGPSTGVPA